MAPLAHPNLVRFFGAVWNEGPDKLCLVLEYVENGDLESNLVEGKSGLWETPRYGFAFGTASCLKYLHHDIPNPLIHRDIKPPNILIDKACNPKASE